jgi:hypothetical protein
MVLNGQTVQLSNGVEWSSGRMVQLSNGVKWSNGRKITRDSDGKKD